MSVFSVPRMMMMVGLPASGKSTNAQKLSLLYGAKIYSSDKLREELFDDVNENSRNEELFNEIHRRIKLDLSNGGNVIYDATNVSWKKRKAFLDSLNTMQCKKICHIIATPYEKCIEQNLARDRIVPQEIIDRMYQNFFVPQYYEGWDDIHLIYNDVGLDLHKLFNGKSGLNYIQQENPYHSLTIGGHCIKCSSICEELTTDFNLHMAALYHDIGKKFTKTYNEEKGYCTYYQHHLVSAYDTLFYIYDMCKDDILEIVNYVQWHMQPFFIKTEKAKNKFIKLVGQEFYDKLMILHEADIKSK